MTCFRVHKEEDRRVLRNSCFLGGEGPDFRPKFQKVFFLAVEVIFLDQIKKNSAYDLLFDG